MEAMSAASLFDTEEPLSVSDLVAQLRDLVEQEYPSVWVAGEISGFVKHASGHWYFTLKDAAAQLKAAMFRGSNLRIKFDPKNGLEVIARGRVSVYSPRGDLQIIVEDLQPKGLGAAELALRQLKEKLLLKGYFAPERKRRLPRYPRRVGLVTSATGAAIRDMVELFAQRWPLAELVIRPSRVQGDGAAAEVAAAIRLLNQFHTAGTLTLDAIVVGRGGGSTEDLWAFNEEAVATAIFESVVPLCRPSARDRRFGCGPRRGCPGRDALGRGGRADTRPPRDDGGSPRIQHAALRGGRTPVATRAAARRATCGAAGAPPAAPARPRPGAAT